MMAAGARLAAKGAGKKDGDIAIIGTDGLPGPSGGIRAVAEGEWAATFTYPTGAPQAIDMAKKILLDCADKVATTRDRADAGDHARQRQVADGQVKDSETQIAAGLSWSAAFVSARPPAHDGRSTSRNYGSAGRRPATGAEPASKLAGPGITQMAQSAMAPAVRLTT